MPAGDGGILQKRFKDSNGEKLHEIFRNQIPKTFTLKQSSSKLQDLSVSDS